jgi:hypothetical protein
MTSREGLRAGKSLEGSNFVSRNRIRLIYLWQFGRLPDLDDPGSFTEWVQWRKLNDRSPHHPSLMDKIAAKRRAEQSLGRDWIIPTLWSGSELPNHPPVRGKAMLKARHGCNQNAIANQPGGASWQALGRRARDWCARPYGIWLDEWAYRPVERGLLLEPFVSDTGALPVDYKIYVFGGHATHVQVHVDRGHDHRWILHDRAFRPLVPSAERAEAPSSLRAMLEAAETLAAGEDFLRVDFYEVAGQPLFGEFCLYPGSGLDAFAAPWIDGELGALWRQARLDRRPMESGLKKPLALP